MRVEQSTAIAPSRPKPHSSPFFPFAILVLIVLGAGCGMRPISFFQEFPPDVHPTPLPTSAAPQPPAVFAFPVGRYRDVALPNLITLEIEPDGHYEIFLDSRLVDLGLLQVSGSQVRIDSIRCQAELYRPALYNWVDDEGDLSFQPAAPDPCPERRQLFHEQYEPGASLALSVHGRD